jgi:hypothetical protein
MVLVTTLILSACGSPPAETVTVTPPPITVTQTITQPGNADSTATPPTVTITVTSPPITIASPPITITTTITATPPPPAEPFIVTEELSYIITQQDANFWYFSWQITIKNMTSEALSLYFEIHFLDAEGFLVEWDNELTELNPQEEKTFRGTTMVDASIAANIVRAVADIS